MSFSKKFPCKRVSFSWFKLPLKGRVRSPVLALQRSSLHFSKLLDQRNRAPAIRPDGNVQATPRCFQTCSTKTSASQFAEGERSGLKRANLRRK